MIHKLRDIVNNLSLSFTISSSICAYVFSKYLYLDLSWAHYIILSLSVWSAYTLDHLADSKKPNTEKVQRYSFHKKHESILKVVIVIAILSCLVLLFFIPLETVCIGFGVLAFCLFYSFSIRKLKFVKRKKEYFAAACISLGVVGILILLALPAFYIKSVPLFVVFFLICLQNLLLFSFFDFKQDKELGFSTEVGSWSKKEFNQTMKGYFVLAFIGIVFIAQEGREALPIFLSLFLMELVLLVLWYKWEDFCEDEKYRFIGDAIFFFPILYFFF